MNVTKKRPPTTWAKVPVLLRSEDVAILLGLTVQQVRTMSRSGEIPCTRVGRTYRYEKQRLMKFVGAETGETI